MGNLVTNRSKKTIEPQAYERHRLLARNAISIMASRNYRIDYTMTELADVLHTNVTTLKQAFREFVGLPPYTFLHAKCMELAAEMIVKGTCITQVAAESGYSTIGHFSNAFKKSFGMPPTCYPKGSNDMNLKVNVIDYKSKNRSARNLILI